MRLRTGWHRYALALAAAAVLSIPVAVSAGCGDSTSSAAPKATVFRAAYTSTITTWDPSASYSTEVAYLSQMYQKLIRANAPGSEKPFSGELATDWSVSDDGKVWTFNLRKGVTFADGTPFNSAAVKYSIMRTKELGLGAGYIWWPLKAIETPDDYTVKFILTEPVPLERLLASSYAAWIFSPKTDGQDQSWWDKNHPGNAGTGPWVLQSYKPNEELVFVRNKTYWGGWKSEQFKKVVVKIISKSTTSRQMLEAGQIDMQGTVSRDDVPEMKQNKDLTVLVSPGFTNYFMCFNTQRAPLDDVKVRQALSYAVPYDDIIKVGANGLGKQSRGPVPEGLWPWDQSLPQYSYDMAKAKQMLADAGYPNGEGIHKLVLTYAAENPQSEKLVPLIKESYAELGIDVEIQPLLWNQQWEKIKGDPKNRQDLVVTMWWPSMADGYDTLNTMFHTEETPAWNFSYWYDSTYDSKLWEAYTSSATDIPKSKQLYIEVQKMLIDQAVAAYLYDAQGVLATQADIKGVEVNPYDFGGLQWYALSK